MSKSSWDEKWCVLGVIHLPLWINVHAFSLALLTFAGCSCTAPLAGRLSHLDQCARFAVHTLLAWEVSEKVKGKVSLVRSRDKVDWTNNGKWQLLKKSQCTRFFIVPCARSMNHCTQSRAPLRAGKWRWRVHLNPRSNEICTDQFEHFRRHWHHRFLDLARQVFATEANGKEANALTVDEFGQRKSKCEQKQKVFGVMRCTCANLASLQMFRISR